MKKSLSGGLLGLFSVLSSCWILVDTLLLTGTPAVRNTEGESWTNRGTGQSHGGPSYGLLLFTPPPTYNTGGLIWGWLSTGWSGWKGAHLGGNRTRRTQWEEVGWRLRLFGGSDVRANCLRAAVGLAWFSAISDLKQEGQQGPEQQTHEATDTK